VSRSSRETTATPWQERGRETGRQREAFVVAGVIAMAFILLSLLVATGTTQHLDDQVGSLLRPHGVWGTAQIRADHIVDDFRPAVLASVLVLAGLWTSIARRSWRPAAFAAAIGGAAVVLTSGVKLIIGRPDAAGQVAPHSGSFPSGHTVGVLVCLGGALLVLRVRTRVWQWVLVGLAALTMGLCLLVERAHWFTDVVGGALLASALLVAAARSPLRLPRPRGVREPSATVSPR
jgi:membrane-associated phospholipid phosphatase